MASTKKERDRAMASYMKDHPGQFPDSTTRPGQGEGAAMRKIANQMNAGGHRTGTWDRGMFGGVLAARLGFGSKNIPAELVGFVIETRAA